MDDFFIRCEATFLEDSYVDIPYLTNQEYTLTDIYDDVVIALMAENSDTWEDQNISNGELGDKIREEFVKGAGQVNVSENVFN